MNQNEPIFLNLYIRDTESYRKTLRKLIGNKQIMRVKKCRYHSTKFYIFYTHSSRTQSSKSLIERMFFGFLCLLYRDSEERE